MDPLALFTLPELKAWCKVPDGQTAHDDVLAAMGDAASAYFESRTGRIFAARTITAEPYRGKGKPSIWLRFFPVISVATLVVDGATVSPSDYVVDQANGRIDLLTGLVPVGPAAALTTYDAGYTTVPAQLKAAALDLTKAHYEEWSAGAIAAASVNVGPAGIFIRPGLNPRVEKYLDSIRDMRM